MDETEKRRILEERARKLSALPATMETALQERQLLVFRLGGERFGVALASVGEIAPVPAVCRVPCTPDFVKGVVNFRGRIISLIDVGRFLGLSPRPVAEGSHMILVSENEEGLSPAMEVALLCDGRPEVRDLPGQELCEPPAAGPSTMAEHSLGVTPDLTVVLDIGRILAAPSFVVYDQG
ncbi:MAG: chemotaxis protein CheW [Thermodesulfobacteriota bacterium]